MRIKTPAEQLFSEIAHRVFSKRPRRATGLQHPLQWYADLYQIPLSTIKKIHVRYNPCALDHPAKLLPLLVEQPGPRIDLRGMERVIEARFAAGLK